MRKILKFSLLVGILILMKSQMLLAMARDLDEVPASQPSLSSINRFTNQDDWFTQCHKVVFSDTSSPDQIFNAKEILEQHIGRSDDCKSTMLLAALVYIRSNQLENATNLIQKVKETEKLTYEENYTILKFYFIGNHISAGLAWYKEIMPEVIPEPTKIYIPLESLVWSIMFEKLAEKLKEKELKSMQNDG